MASIVPSSPLPSPHGIYYSPSLGSSFLDLVLTNNLSLHRVSKSESARLRRLNQAQFQARQYFLIFLAKSRLVLSFGILLKGCLVRDYKTDLTAQWGKSSHWSLILPMLKWYSPPKARHSFNPVRHWWVMNGVLIALRNSEKLIQRSLYIFFTSTCFLFLCLPKPCAPLSKLFHRHFLHNTVGFVV